MKEIAQILVLFLVLISCANAISLEDRLITIKLDTNGKAHVIEEFTISFSTTTEVDNFKGLAGINELSAWKNFFNIIEPSVLGEKTNLQIVSKVDSLGFGRILIDYYVSNCAKLENESGRFLTKNVRSNQTSFYDAENKIFTLPPKATLQFQVFLPKIELYNVENYVTTFPSALFSGPYVDQKTGTATYIIRGPASASEFSFSYKIEKGLGEWDVQNIINTIYTWAFTNPIYTLVILTVIVLVVVYRYEIFNLLVESFSGEEEVELPKREL